MQVVFGGPLNIINLVFTIAAFVYLADVRPALNSLTRRDAAVAGQGGERVLGLEAGGAQLVEGEGRCVSDVGQVPCPRW